MYEQATSRRSTDFNHSTLLLTVVADGSTFTLMQPVRGKSSRVAYGTPLDLIEFLGGHKHARQQLLIPTANTSMTRAQTRSNAHSSKTLENG